MEHLDKLRRCCLWQKKTDDGIDHLNTRNMLKRRHYRIANDDYGCILCATSPEETLVHLFFHCPFSKDCWRTLGVVWPNDNCTLRLVHSGREVWGQPMFMEMFVVAAWGIWKERNDKLFRGVTPSHGSWLTRFKRDFALLVHRANPRLEPFIFSLEQSL